MVEREAFLCLRLVEIGEECLEFFAIGPFQPIDFNTLRVGWKEGKLATPALVWKFWMSFGIDFVGENVSARLSREFKLDTQWTAFSVFRKGHMEERRREWANKKWVSKSTLYITKWIPQTEQGQSKEEIEHIVLTKNAPETPLIQLPCSNAAAGKEDQSEEK